jgi:ABC-type cobalamin/Fe3+-siderophores transport system ATPase subunit
MMPKLILPNPDDTSKIVEIEHNGSAVIIGANGSGKSRLGTWIERNAAGGTIVHRISAQRALNIPEYATIKSLEQSLNELLWGNSDSRYANNNYKFSHRWGNVPDTFLQNDYDKVLSTLFARSAERDRKHAKETRDKKTYIEVADAPIDIMINLWKEIFPHRDILLEDGKVIVIDPIHTSSYHGKEMSDGERVALYLMGQCLCAPESSILVIDEPDLHLHTSIMQSLWNKLEQVKPSCLFLYITHDLNFASTRVSAKNIWTKEYDGKKWTWEIVPEVSEFPETLLLEVLGNRRKVIFVEGEKGGKDYAIYQSIYRDCTIIPRSGCSKVIESVKSMKLNANLHHVEAIGIIDRDYRTDREIDELRTQGIYCLDVAEIENILINEEALREVAKNQKLGENIIVDKVKDFVKKSLQNDIERQVSLRTCMHVEYLLNKINNKAITLSEIKKTVTETIQQIDVDGIYKENTELYTKLSTSGTLDEMLKYYNNKGLLPNMSPIFELGKNGYEKIVMRLLNSSQRDSIVKGMKHFLPTI